VRSLGLDEFAIARQMGVVDAEGRGGPVSVATGEVPRLRGQLPPAEIEEPPDGIPLAEHLVRSMFQQVWNWRLLDRIPHYYSATAVIKTSTDLTLNGPVPLRHHILDWLAGFSDIALSIEHMMSNDRSGGTVVATRWRLDGTHDGPGRWGDPTGRRVTLMGFSHQLVTNGTIVAEWTVFDEFALLKQIHTPDWVLQPPFEPARVSAGENEGTDPDA
jgi:predicted ester cyclase